MKKLRIGINGFGRIGRLAARIILKNHHLELAAINSRADSSSHSYLLKYDSSYGEFDQSVSSVGDYLLVDGNKIACTSEAVTNQIPWNKSGIGLVIDATGKFRTKEDLKGHLKPGVKYVVLSAPAKDDTKTIILGVNQNSFDKKRDKIVSNSSCTTNCLAVVVKIIDDNLEIAKAFMTTTHAATDSQNLLDNSHAKEVRLRRSAFSSIIPASTGSAKDIVKLYPHLKDKIICQALRIPLPTVSLINLSVITKRKTSVEEVNKMFKQASQTDLKTIVAYVTEELVSIDYKGSPFSAIFDSNLTRVIDGNFVSIFAWYDNEWGYATRLVNLCEYIGKQAHLI